MCSRRMSEPGRQVFVAFGKVANPGRAMEGAGEELAPGGPGLGQQVALVGAGTGPFRLNSGNWMRARPELVAALPGRHDLRTLCRDRLEVLLPSFAAGARRWVHGYLDRVEGLVPERAEDDGQVTAPSDRFFAALLPLPLPRVTTVTRAEGKIAATGDGFARLDLAFWDGTCLTGILFGAQNAQSPNELRTLERFAASAGPLFDLQRITGPAGAEALASEMAQRVCDVPGPWFGPYRAEALSRPLP